MAEANRDQAAYWNGEVGQRWAASRTALDAIFAPLTEALFARAALTEGGAVLDIGCGAGETALIAARRLGPNGRVTATDLSAPLLAAARERAAAEKAGAAPIAWIEADAQSDDLGVSTFGHALSRFGVMFFADSVAAFANIRRALAPEGRLTLLCWRGIAENPWVAVPRAVVLHLAGEVAMPPPDAPGPFRFAEPDSLLPILVEAGFRDVTCDRLDRRLVLGRSATGSAGEAAAAAADFAVDCGPVARLLRERAPDLRARAHAAVAQAFVERVEDGAVALDAGCWLVGAVR